LGRGVSLAISRGHGGFDMTTPGVLAHEICHRYAARAFAQAWRRSRRLPDMVDEIAAISCEPEEMKASRLDLFARLFAEGKSIPWEEFLITGHPLKTDPAMVRALAQLGKSGKGAATFEIKPGSTHGSKVALFYAQAAAFGEFLTVRSCRASQAIGGLLTTYDPHTGLDQWLRSRGADFCLPSSLAGFKQSFAHFIKQGRGPRSADPLSRSP
jgi:hypothetical protein